MSKNESENNFKLIIGVIIIWILATYKTIGEFYNAHPILLVVIVVIVLSTIIVTIQLIVERRRNKWLAIEKIEDMHKLHWREFEEFIEFVLQEKWFKTEIWPWMKDWWIDIHASLDWRKYLIQCKKWTNYKVSEPNIREFYGAMNDFDNNAKWIYITTSNLTVDAKNFAERNEIEVWDEISLERYVQEYTWKSEPKEEKQIEEKIKQTHICEKCWWKMIERKAKFWTNKWNVFLGCENYPKCKNIINI